MNGAERIAAERRRQVEVEGYDPREERFVGGTLAAAAIAYLFSARGFPEHGRTHWPWDKRAYKPKSAVRDLERAGALVAAALDAEAPHPSSSDGAPSEATAHIASDRSSAPTLVALNAEPSRTVQDPPVEADGAVSSGYARLSRLVDGRTDDEVIEALSIGLEVIDRCRR